MSRIDRILLGAALLAAGQATAATCSANSPAHTVALLELYTSEGCSSCPPADRWLSSLRPDSNSVVPLALHVDYWNYLGWPDPFSQAQFSARQREVARWNRLNTIYTPQVTLQGQDFRSWGGSRFDDTVQAINQRPARANLSLRLNLEPGQATLSLTGQVLDANTRAGAQAFIALTENRLTTRVPAGENAGRTLQHDHVVRSWLGPFQVGADGRIDLQRALPLDASWNLANLSGTAFVQDRRNGDVLQALSLTCRG